nr:MAG TPA: PulE-GspE/GspE The type II secretory pathway [Caudoviricetes sp.]
MMQDGVEVYCLPDTAHCKADEQKRNPLDIDECPEGCEECTGDGYYYAE